MKKRFALAFAGVLSACATIGIVKQPIRLDIEKIPDTPVIEKPVLPAPPIKQPGKPVQRTYHAKRSSEGKQEDCSGINTGILNNDMKTKLDCLIRAVEKDQQKGS